MIKIQKEDFNLENEISFINKREETKFNIVKLKEISNSLATKARVGKIRICLSS